jgi:hypothetical protein
MKYLLLVIICSGLWSAEYDSLTGHNKVVEIMAKEETAIKSNPELLAITSKYASGKTGGNTGYNYIQSLPNIISGKSVRSCESTEVPINMKGAMKTVVYTLKNEKKETILEFILSFNGDNKIIYADSK